MSYLGDKILDLVATVIEEESKGAVKQEAAQVIVKKLEELLLHTDSPISRAIYAKHRFFEMYGHLPWFTGCRVNRDDRQNPHVELLYDPENPPERFTYKEKCCGIGIKLVPFRRIEETHDWPK